MCRWRQARPLPSADRPPLVTISFENAKGPPISRPLRAACHRFGLRHNPHFGDGNNDDWSYIWVARMFATTGHLVYNGWIGAMIGFQAVWAALLIRIFGFSFTLVRLSTLPFAAGCAVLLYRLFRGAGLNTLLAMFGTLTVVLSPLFIPLAASFMTDVPGFFFWLASVYCAILAANAQTDHGATAWMAACAIAGAMGGTVRQVVWIVPLVVLPAAAYVRRTDPRR